MRESGLAVMAALAVVGGTGACGGASVTRPAATSAKATPGSLLRDDEVHLADLRQLTFGGENAEAYWSFAGDQLVYQAHREAGPEGGGCDRIYRLPLAGVVGPSGSPPPARTPSPDAGAAQLEPNLGLAPAAPLPVSSGAGATTCGFFLPGDRELIYASTHLAGSACPPRPDRRGGYVWAISPSYDIFRARVDGGALRRLTETPGYDAEGTVCGVDGSIVFTSMRDGDLELYRMDSDGGHVRRLTHAIGYDGGAFFDRDCSHIVWRASRPAAGPERDEYQRLASEGLVRPSKLELWVADADGSNPMQITYLGAASFAPTFMIAPASPERVLFSSNYGDPRGREFDLWAVDVTGANLERVTSAPGFDGFPMFSADGQRLAFSSNRATPVGRHDTNVFVARWQGGAPRRFAETAADRILADVRYLADPARAGRGIGTPGLEASATYIETRLRALGLEAGGVAGTYRQPFEVPVRVRLGAQTHLDIAGAEVPPEDFRPATFSSSAAIATAPLVLAGYGLEDPAAGVNDYAGLSVTGKIAVVRRFVPEVSGADANAERQRRAGDVRRKAFVAREHGAIALLVVDAPPAARQPPAAPRVPRASTRASLSAAHAAAEEDPASDGSKSPEEAPLPVLRTEGYGGDAGLPVMFVRRRALAPALARLEHGAVVTASLEVKLTAETVKAANIVARVRAQPAGGRRRLPGVVVVGAHYDHLGMGEAHSLDPASHKPHLGADDNASGTATLLEIARALAERKTQLERDVIVVAFSGEEEGVLGSTAFTRAPPGDLQRLKDVVAMVNFDMVGRLRDNHVTILGRGSAREWGGLLESACGRALIDCGAEGAAGGAASDGFGPSDQMPFYASGIPVAHFFTGNHGDYHRPSDTADKINAAGAGQIAVAGEALVESVAALAGGLTLTSAAAVAAGSAGQGDMRSFGASLGTIPDYAGPPGGVPGVLLAGVRAGGAAARGGLQRGDILVHLGSHEIRSVEDLMYALGASHPGQTVDAVVERGGHTVTLPVTFQGPSFVAGGSPSSPATKPLLLAPPPRPADPKTKQPR